MIDCVRSVQKQFSTTVQIRRRMIHLALLTAFIVSAGCSGGNDGPVRFPLAGTVTFDGKPVMDGEIFLQPDSAAGNSGPASIAGIRDSKYSIPVEQGVVGGPYLVKITAYEVPKGAQGRMALPLL